MAAGEWKLEDYLSRVPPENQHRLNNKIASDIELAEIAQSYTGWQGTAPYLGLKDAEVEDILNSRNVGVQRIKALQRWRQMQGFRATYKNLASRFHNAHRPDMIQAVLERLGASFSSDAAVKELATPVVHHATSQSQQDDVNTPDLLQLLKFPGKTKSFSIASEIGVKYMEFGVFLLKDATGAKVAAIAQKHMFDSEQINIKILQLWLAGEGMDVSWETLVGVLSDVGLGELATEIADIKSQQGIALPKEEETDFEEGMAIFSLGYEHLLNFIVTLFVVIKCTL
jgi:hypothetical protein